MWSMLITNPNQPILCHMMSISTYISRIALLSSNCDNRGPPLSTLPGACHGVLEEALPLRGRAVQDDSRGLQGEAGVFLIVSKGMGGWLGARNGKDWTRHHFLKGWPNQKSEENQLKTSQDNTIRLWGLILSSLLRGSYWIFLAYSSLPCRAFDTSLRITEEFIVLDVDEDVGHAAPGSRGALWLYMAIDN